MAYTIDGYGWTPCNTITTSNLDPEWNTHHHLNVEHWMHKHDHHHQNNHQDHAIGRQAKCE